MYEMKEIVDGGFRIEDTRCGMHSAPGIILFINHLSLFYVFIMKYKICVVTLQTLLRGLRN